MAPKKIKFSPKGTPKTTRKKSGKGNAKSGRKGNAWTRYTGNSDVPF